MTLAALFFGAVNIASAASPVERTEAFLAALRRVQARPDGAALDDGQRRANAVAFRALDEFFDFDRLVDEPIAPYRERFTAPELTRYRAEFREVIRLQAFPSSSRALSDARYNLRPVPSRRGGRFADVVMSVRFEGEKRDAAIAFHWLEGPSGWRIYDLSIDGASLVESYRQQFGRMLKEGSVDTLLGRLSARLDDKRRERVIP
jgi:phospholipid transport system substrate-binding protein